MVVDLPAGQRRKANERRESEVRKAVHHRKVEHHKHASGGATARKKTRATPPSTPPLQACCLQGGAARRPQAVEDGRTVRGRRTRDVESPQQPGRHRPSAMAAASLSAPQHVNGPTATGQPHLKGAVALALTRVDVAADNDRHVILLASGHG